MDKLYYISKQLSRTQNKKFENYVVTRIWHRLNDLSIKFVTQQYVSRPEGRALTDIYFPQFAIHVEVDEKQHKECNNIELDKIREADIINATGHEILRIDVTKDIEFINNEIEIIIDKIKALKNKNTETNTFKHWDIEAEQNPQTYIDKGFIQLEDDVAFKTIVDAINCFGYNYKGFQKAGINHPIEKNKLIWFPKLYENDGWDNQITLDESVIKEICKLHKKKEIHFDKIINDNVYTRIIFARVKSSLGDIMYRFKGEYELDIALSSEEFGLVWKKKSNNVKTYRHEH